MPDTIVVALRRPWWNQHELKHYPRSPEGVEMPADNEALLPSTAVVLTEIEVRKEKRRARKAKPKDKPIALSELAPDKTLSSDFAEA